MHLGLITEDLKKKTLLFKQAFSELWMENLHGSYNSLSLPLPS